MNENRVPTYGDIVTSMDYDAKLKRHQWFKRNKARLMAGGIVVLAAALMVAILTLI